MKKHHLKHAGFFLAILTLLFNTVFIASYAPRSTEAAGGGTPFEVNIAVAGSGGKTTYESPAWPAGSTCPGSQCYVEWPVSPSDGADQLTINTILESGKRVKSWVFVPTYGTTAPLNCTQGNNTNKCTISIPAGADMLASGVRSYSLTVTIEDDVPAAPPPAETPATPAPQTTTSTPKTTTTKTTANTTTSTTSTVTDVAFNGQANQSSSDPTKVPEYKADDSIILTGTAAPNSTVNIYVYSDPQKVTTTADKDGKWTVTLPKLPEGEHHVESAIVDASGNEGARQQLGSFKVFAAVTPQATTKQATVTTKKSSSNSLLIAMAVVSLFAIGYIVWYWWHHKRSILIHHTVGTPPPGDVFHPKKS